jgi:hypothetical protein
VSGVNCRNPGLHKALFRPPEKKAAGTIKAVSVKAGNRLLQPRLKANAMLPDLCVQTDDFPLHLPNDFIAHNELHARWRFWLCAARFSPAFTGQHRNRAGT